MDRKRKVGSVLALLERQYKERGNALEGKGEDNGMTGTHDDNERDCR